MNGLPRAGPRRAVGTPVQITALSLALWAVAALVALGFFDRQDWSATGRWPWFIALSVLALLFALAEIFVVHLRIRADAHTFSLVELPLALGLFFVQPLVLVSAQLLGAGLALALHRKQGPLKLLFNGAVFSKYSRILGSRSSPYSTRRRSRR